MNQLPVQANYFEQKTLGKAVFTHYLDCGKATLVGELELAVIPKREQAVSLHTGNSLGNGRAGVLQAFRDSSAHGCDALFLKLQNGLEIHFRRVN